MSSIYEDTFANVRNPPAVFTAVTDRIRLQEAFTEDLAAYYHERAAVEEAYVKSLQKLSGRLHDGGSSTVFSAVAGLGLDRNEQKQQLGAWATIRTTLEREVIDTARVHDGWRTKITSEVTEPLRKSLNKAQWSSWQQAEAQLESTVKEYDSTLDKVQKNQTKSSKSNSSKLLNNQSQLSTLGSSLTSSLPTFLSQSQALEEAHSAFLKEALVRAGTCASDLGRERMEAGERLLNGVLGVDEQVEMQTWALRESMRAGNQPDGSRAVANTNEFGSSSLREDSIMEEPSQLQTPTQERQRVPSISRTAPPPAAPLPLPVPTPTKKEKGKGFKSLFKRDKSGSANSSKYGNLNVPGAGNSSSTNLGNSARDTRPSVDSRDSDSINVPEEATGSGRPGVNRAPSANSDLFGGSQSGLPEPIMPASRDRGASTSSGSKKRESLMPFGGGSLFRRSSKMGSPQLERRESDLEFGQPATTSTSVPQSSVQPSVPSVDEDGYSVPPAGYDRQIGETERSNANLMDEDDEEDDRSALPALPSSKISNVALAPATITESEAERQAALDRVKSTLLSSSAAPAANLARRQTRGRRDVRMTTYNPTIPDDVPLARVMEQQQQQQRSQEASMEQPLSQSQGSGAISPIGSSFAPERAMSMLSAHSGFAARGAGVDPFEHSSGSGLRVAITETVNVLSKAGVVQRVMITGEIALSYRSNGMGDDNLRIRIANFEQFEKAAPNSAYLSPIVDSPGEYNVSPSLANNSQTATVLKYQLHIAAGTEQSFVPLQVKAMWKCEPTQTKVIVNYSANPNVKIAEKDESPFGEEDDSSAATARLEELSFSVPMSTSVSTFQAKPTADWSADKAKLTFNVDPLPFSSSEDKKLLALMMTDGAASPQPVAVKWKVVGATVSRVSVEIVGGQQQVEEIVRTSVAGKYLVAP